MDQYQSKNKTTMIVDATTTIDASKQSNAEAGQQANLYDKTTKVMGDNVGQEFSIILGHYENLIKHRMECLSHYKKA